MQPTLYYKDSFIKFYFKDHRFCPRTQLPLIFPIISHYMDYEIAVDNNKTVAV